MLIAQKFASNDLKDVPSLRERVAVAGTHKGPLVLRALIVSSQRARPSAE